MKFKVGDRVRPIASFDRSNGTIICISYNGDEIGVEHDKHMRGHDLNGRCKDGHGWYYCSKNLDFIISDNILILLL
jgi:hypothetical protein